MAGKQDNDGCRGDRRGQRLGAAPPAELAPEPAPETAAAADPSYIWDLAATDVFPAATEAAVPQDDGPEADED